MKTFNGILSILLVLTLTTGCSFRTASPTLIGNNYFYVGDTDCARYVLKAGNIIYCFKSDGTYTGLRSNMSEEQLRMYRHYESIEQSRRQMQDEQMLRSNLRY